MYYIGADIGGTTIKLVAADENGRELGCSKQENRRDISVIESFIKTSIPASETEDITLCATGIGSGLVSSLDTGRRIVYNEFECIAAASRKMTGLDRLIAVSMGTGTAFVIVDNDSYEYIGGTGVGGGTFMGLCERFTGISDYEELNILAHKGDTRRIDLTVGDISNGTTEGIDPDITASNFGKRPRSDKGCDLAAASATLIYEAAGVMAAFACRSTDIKNVVFVGSFASSLSAERILSAVGKIHGLRYIIPENAVYAAAMGAVLLGRREGRQP